MKKLVLVGALALGLMSFVNSSSFDPPSEEQQGNCYDFAIGVAGGEGGSYEVFGWAYDWCIAL